MFKNLSKKILKSSAVTSLGAFLIALWIKLVFHTTRWQVVNPDVLDMVREKFGNSVVVAFWHGRLMMNPVFVPKDVRMNVLISNSRDGELIARVQSCFNIASIRGSTAKQGKADKGGAAAIRQMLAAKERGETVAITPDGPRGPARKVSPNALNILKKLAMPIIPVTFSCSKYKEIKSWDSFRLAKPFGKGVFVFGQPILPGGEEELENILNKLTDEADFVVKAL